MSHISNGDLHAYLDGALNEYSTVEAARIRAHLETCGECTERLNDERLLRDEATAILSGTLPAIDMPPFEELRARAEATSAPESARSGRPRLVWAASIMLALAVGYGVRGSGAPQSATRVAAAEPAAAALQQGPAAGIRESLDEAADEVVAASATSDAAEDGAFTTTGASMASRPAPTSSQAPAVASPVDASPVVAMAEVSSVAEVEATPPAAIDEIVTDMTGRVGLGDIAESGKVAFRTDLPVAEGSPAAPRAEEVAATPQVRRTVLGDVVADAAVVPAREQGGEGLRRERMRTPVVSAIRQGTAGTRIVRPRTDVENETTATEEDSVDEGSMVVPGLDVVSISWLAEGVVAGGVQVEQMLENGDRLILLHLPEGVAPADVPPEAEAGEWELVVPRGRGWLILRAERSIDELTELAARLDGEGQG